MNTRLASLMLAFVLTGRLGPAQTDAPVVEDFQPSSLNQPGRQYPLVNSERRVRVRVTAPEARSVALEFLGGAKYTLTRDESGAWVGVTRPQDEGFHYYQLLIDGAGVPDPGTLYFYGGSRWGSGVEVPARDRDFYASKNVPHGQLRRTLFYSKSAQAVLRCYVYTPPDYDQDPARRYPVLYLQHGGGEDETGWGNQGMAGLIMDNLLAEGRTKPFLVVMANSYVPGSSYALGGRAASTNPPAAGAAPGGTNAPPAGGAPGPGGRRFDFGPFQRVLLEDLIPHVDTHFRTLADPAHRAMAGLSMGGMQTRTIALAHLDTFSHIGVFSGGSIAPSDIADLETFKRQARLVFVSYGSRELTDGRARFGVDPKANAEQLRAAGVNSHFYLSPDTGHEWLSWRRSLYQFAPLLFRDEPDRAARNHSNPILHADVPDIAMIRVGDAYYMSSTTMHLSPGVPIMKSTDLANWEIVQYAYDTLEDVDAMNLENGRNAYGKGSWASSLRHHQGTFYVTTFAQTTGKTHVYSTRDLERGPWKATSFRPALHDHSLFFDDDDRVYMLYGAGNLRLAELNPDLSGLKPGGFHDVVITNASAVAGPGIGLPAEGSQLIKVHGRYYLFNIVWPRGGMRTVLVHRADRLAGPWEGRVALADKGVAQGSIIDTPGGDWFAYLFQDAGAVGRIPYLVPVRWEDDWPVLGENGKVPDTLNLPAGRGLIPGIVASDEFDRHPGERPLPWVWQWNHQPDPRFWSLAARPGYLRLTTGRVDPDLESARNTLTQRTIGPECSGSTSLDVSHLQDGDFAGLVLLAKNYGIVGVKSEGGTNYLVMVSAESHPPVELERVPLNQSVVHLRADCDFKDRADRARFHYSLDGESWRPIGGSPKMKYTLAHFMGYRFGLFNFSTRTAGGHADFDFFRIRPDIPGDGRTSSASSR